MRRVWPDAIVEENNLTVTISALRKALGEGPTDREYIETVPRRGYRFVADFRASAESTEAVRSPQERRGPAGCGYRTFERGSRCASLFRRDQTCQERHSRQHE